MGHPFFLSRVIVQGEYLAKYLFPSCRRHGSPVLPAIIPIGPFWHFTGLGKHEQDAVEQAVLLKTFRQQFVYALGLCGPDDVDARLFNMHRYRAADPCHIQCPAAPCREQLLYELPVGVAVGGVEHAHDFVHQDDHAAGIVVVCQQERFRSEVGYDRAPQYRLPAAFPGGLPCLQFRLIRLEQGIVVFSYGTVCRFQRRCLAQSRPAHEDDVEGGVALPLAFDADTVGASQCGRYRRQHGRRDELGLVVLVPDHVKDDGLNRLRKHFQREAGVFGMFRLHADHVAQFKSGVYYVSHFSSCNRMSHSRISLPSAHAGHRTWRTCSCCPP